MDFARDLQVNRLRSEPEGHDRRLRAGRRASKARGAKQFGQTGEKRLRFGGPSQAKRIKLDHEEKAAISRNFFILLASPTGFEPVLPP